MKSSTRTHQIARLAWLSVAAVVALAGAAQAKDEVDRIREKCDELAREVQSEHYSHYGEGKDPNLIRVYKDFDYLLKDSKNEEIRKALETASDPARKDRLERLDQYLLSQRMLYAVAPSIDNMNRYETTASMAVAGSDVKLTLRTYASMLANEENRTNRRIWYLASRDLEENANVFRLNLLIDLNREARTLADTTYPAFLANMWGLDEARMVALAEESLSSTEAEYQSLLEQVVPTRLEGKEVDELRQYDVPYLLRASHLDDTFRGGKAEDVVGKWLRKMGIDVGSQKRLRVKVEFEPGMAAHAETFPIQMSNDTRIAVPIRGGLPEYWELFWQMGEAQFYYNVDPDRPFEAQRVGSPVVPMTYGYLFQSVLADPAWRAEFLDSKNDETEIQTFVRLNQLHNLRVAAGRYLFQHELHQDLKTPASRYSESMQRAMLWTHGATEEANFLRSADHHASGMYLMAAMLAEQLSQKFQADYGEQWWADANVGKWLKQQWKAGFPSPSADVAIALGVADAGAAAGGE